MPVDIKWDVSNGAELVHGATSTRLVRNFNRPGIITGLSSALTNEELLFAARDELLSSKALASVHPEDDDYILRQYIIRPYTQGKATFTAVYEPFEINSPTGAPLSVIVLEDDTVVQAIQRNWFEDGGTIKFVNPSFIDSNVEFQNPGGQYTAMMPVRVLRATLTVQGAVPNDPGNYVGYVNSEASYKGRGKGGWMIQRVNTLAYYGGSSFTATIQLARAPHAPDWRNIVVARNTITGKLFEVSSGDKSGALTTEYKKGEIFLGQGIQAIGDYETVSFSSLGL